MIARFTSLFEDVTTGPSKDDCEVFQPARPRLAVVVALVLLVAGAVCLYKVLATDNGTPDVLLRGARVGQLQPGSAIVLEDEEVGFVDWIGIQNGQAVARLKFDPTMRERVPKNAKFSVRSLNALLPGNVGVVISIPAKSESPGPVDLSSTSPRSSDVSSGRSLIDGKRDVVADGSPTPAYAPVRFYALPIGVLVLLGAVTIAWRIALRLPFVVALAAILAASLAVKHDAISFVAVREWLRRLLAVLAASVALLSTTGLAGAQDLRTPMTFLVCIDRSGSMLDKFPAPVQVRLSDATKLEDVKRRLSLLAAYLPGNTRVLVTVFDHEATLVCDILLDSSAARTNLQKAFASINSREGSTYLWRTADAQLALAKQLAEANPEGRVRLLLYTDGEDMEKAPGLDHNTIIAKYGSTLQTVVALDWITLGYDLKADVKKALEDRGVQFTRAENPEDIVPLKAAFTLSESGGVAGTELRLLDESIGINITRRLVDWGDGTPYEEGDALRHRYEKPGEYRIRYLIKSAGGRSSQSTSTVTISPPAAAKAQFFLSSSQIKVGDSVTASDQTEGNLTSWRWAVDRQEISTKRSVALSFDKAGKHTIELTVCDAYGQISQVCKEIDVESPPPPVASINASRTRVDAGETVHLSDATEAEIARRLWTLPGRKTSDAQVASIRLDEPGEYEIVLTIEDKYGQSAQARKLIVVRKPALPKAAFRLHPPKPSVGQTVTAVNESSESSTRCLWELPDGRTTTEEHVSFEVSEFGDLRLKLTVWDRFGQSNSVSHTLAISRPGRPRVDFVSPESLHIGTEAKFYDRSSGEIQGNGQWTVNGEEISSGRDVGFTPTKPGRYVVRRVVSGPGGMSELSRELIAIGFEPPSASFTVGNNTPFLGDAIVITDTSHGDIDRVVFEWDQAEQPITFEPQHDERRSFSLTCARVGAMTISQTVFGPGGEDRSRQEIVVTSRSVPPRAIFNVKEIEGDDHAVVHFHNISLGQIVRTEFDPGDGSAPQIAEGPADFRHRYAPGVWTANITVFGTDEFSPSRWKSDQFEVAHPLPAWVQKLSWQLPLGTAAILVAWLVVKRKASRRLMKKRALLAGQLEVRRSDKPRVIKHFNFDGIAAEEVVSIVDGDKVRISSEVDHDAQIVRYRVDLVLDEATLASADMEDGAEIRLGDYLVTYAA
jgi:PKD repeat protein